MKPGDIRSIDMTAYVCTSHINFVIQGGIQFRFMRPDGAQSRFMTPGSGGLQSTSMRPGGLQFIFVRPGVYSPHL